MNKEAEVRITALQHAALLPLILKLAMPSIIGISVSAGYQLLNAFYIGILGTFALAAMSLTFPLAMLLTVVGQCFGAGAASNIARCLGRNDRKEAGLFATAAVIIGTMTVLMLAGLLLFIAKPLLVAIGATVKTLPSGLVYADWLLAGYVANVFNMVCGFIVRAEGNTQFSMKTIIVAFALNALLDPLLIFWLHLGIAGAGLATLLSQSVSVLMYLYYFLRRRGVIELVLTRQVLTPARTLAIITIGAPTAISILASVITMLVMNKLTVPFGDNAVAGIGIATRLFSIALLPVSGLCIGAQSVLGFNIGTGNLLRVRTAVLVQIKLALIFTCSYALVVTFFAADIVRSFSKDQGVLAIAGHAVRLFHFGLPLFALQSVTMSLLQAKGDAIYASLLAVARQGLLMLPLMLILQQFQGINGIIFLQILADAITGILAGFVLIRQLNSLKANDVKSYKEDFNAALKSKQT